MDDQDNVNGNFYATVEMGALRKTDSSALLKMGYRKKTTRIYMPLCASPNSFVLIFLIE
jgi:hypothetical protein